MRNAYKMFAGKEALAKPRRRWRWGVKSKWNQNEKDVRMCPGFI
jgi:hypothetical protein